MVSSDFWKKAKVVIVVTLPIVLSTIYAKMSASTSSSTEDAARTSKTDSDNIKPSLIVFDLDYTLWPFWVDTHVDPPFSMKGSKVVDSHGQTIKYYPEVPEVLEYIQSLGIPMGVASRTSEIDGANQLVSLFGWSKYFQYKEIYPGCKVNHFGKFKKATGLPFQSMMFFDDEDRNIRDLTKEGVHCVLVRKGVTMKLVKDSLQDFANKAKSQKGFAEYFKPSS